MHCCKVLFQSLIMQGTVHIKKIQLKEQKSLANFWLKHFLLPLHFKELFIFQKMFPSIAQFKLIKISNNCYSSAPVTPLFNC